MKWPRWVAVWCLQTAAALLIIWLFAVLNLSRILH